MQTQNQKFIKWVPKRDTYVQKVFKKSKDEVFVPKEAKKKFEVVDKIEENKEDRPD